jgi:hypothetical protein
MMMAILSENTVDYFTAKAKAIGEMETPKKNCKNPYFSSMYADLASIVDATRKPLADNQLVPSQYAENTPDGGMAVTTRLTHGPSGQFEQTTLTMRPMYQVKGGGWEESQDPQTLATAITYARRYSLSALLGLASEPEDDGNSSSDAKTKTEGRQQQPQRQQRPATKAAQQELPPADAPPPAKPAPSQTGSATALVSFTEKLWAALEATPPDLAEAATIIAAAITRNKDGKLSTPTLTACMTAARSKLTTSTPGILNHGTDAEVAIIEKLFANEALGWSEGEKGDTTAIIESRRMQTVPGTTP